MWEGCIFLFFFSSSREKDDVYMVWVDDFVVCYTLGTCRSGRPCQKNIKEKKESFPWEDGMRDLFANEIVKL